MYAVLLIFISIWGQAKPIGRKADRDDDDDSTYSSI